MVDFISFHIWVKKITLCERRDDIEEHQQCTKCINKCLSENVLRPFICINKCRIRNFLLYIWKMENTL